MSQQLVRTLAFVAAAVVLAGGAYLTYPRAQEFRVSEAVKKPLFPQFKDPQQAARIVITKIDEELGQLMEFEVVKDPERKIWVIPSHERYPADDEDRIRDASTALIDLIPVDFVSQESRDQATFGLLKPSQETEASQTGIGLLVSIEDAKGNKLAELIIGKKGRKGNSDEDQADPGELYFVRRPGQDAIYVAEIDPGIFSTQFKDWIKEDLLQLDSFDVRRVEIDDYTVPHEVRNSERGIQIRPDVENLKRRLRAVIDWDDTGGQWSLKSLTTYQGTRPIPTSLGELEELNSEKLNDLKQTLSSLKIVNVRRKPEGLGADLKAGRDFLNKRESLISLQTVGFYPWPIGNQLELFAENGELVVATKDGVEYLLRFGRTDSVEVESDQLNRFLMVTARIDESQFTELPADVRRELEQGKSAEPAGPPEPKKADKDESSAPQPPAPLPQDPLPQDQSAQQKKQSDKTQKAAETKQSDEEAPKNPLRDGGKQEKKSQTPPSEEKESAEEKPSEKKSSEKTAEGAEQNQPKSDGEKAKSTAEGDSEKKKEEDEDDEAAKEAQRKLDELKDKFKKARAKVADLNYRFGDWYYVVSEEDYRKIHLTRRDLIRETTQAKKKGFDIDAFRNLQEEGLKPATPGGNGQGSGSPSGQGN